MERRLITRKDLPEFVATTPEMEYAIQEYQDKIVEFINSRYVNS